MRHLGAHLHHPTSVTVLDDSQVGKVAVDPVPEFGEASSIPSTRRAVGLAEDGGEQSLVASGSVRHQHQVFRVFEPVSGSLHQFLDQPLVPPAPDKADQKAAFGIDRGSLPEGFALAPYVAVTLVHLNRGCFDLLDVLVVEAPGVISYVPSQPSDGLWAHPYQARGALRRDAFSQVLGYTDSLALLDFGVE